MVLHINHHQKTLIIFFIKHCFVKFGFLNFGLELIIIIYFIINYLGFQLFKNQNLQNYHHFHYYFINVKYSYFIIDQTVINSIMVTKSVQHFNQNPQNYNFNNFNLNENFNFITLLELELRLYLYYHQIHKNHLHRHH